MRVKDWMSPDPVTVSPETSVREARGLLRYYGVRHLPVMDHERVVGMISDRDVRIEDEALGLVTTPEELEEVAGERQKVRAVMASPVHVIGPDEAIEAAARSMLSWRISALPVVDPVGQLLGVITSTDCLLASLTPKGAPEGAVTA